MPQVSDMTAVTSLDSDDLLYVVDTSAGASRKITYGDLLGTLPDNLFTVVNAAAPTKKLRFDASNIAAGQTRVLTAPDYDGTIATLAGTETLTNKTLTAPTINGAVGGTATSQTITALTTTTINGVAAPTAQFTSADEAKLDGIEAGADVTGSTNVLSSLTGQALAVATVDTGQGAVECYAMDQAVRTSDDVTFNTVDVTDAATTRTNLGLGSGDSPSFSGITVAPTETYEQDTIKNFFEDDVWSTGCIRGGVPEIYDGTRQSVSSITRSGSTATATVSSHGYSNGDTISIAGADQSEYNGEFAISNVATNTFDFTVSGTPTTPATGTITAAWTTPIDPRGAVQLGRNIAAQAHGLFRLFRQSGTSTRPNSEKARIGLDANDNLALMAGANDTPALVVDSSGNVGIGGIDPSTLLHIETTDPTFRFKRSDAGTNAYGEITVDTAGLVQVKCDPGGAAGGSGFRIAVDGSTAAEINTTAATFSVPVHLKSYTVATLPSASTAAGLIYVSDETGGAVPAFSDGTNWRRVTDRAVVS